MYLRQTLLVLICLSPLAIAGGKKDDPTQNTHGFSSCHQRVPFSCVQQDPDPGYADFLKQPCTATNSSNARVSKHSRVSRAAAVDDKSVLWPKAIVPYAFDSSLSSTVKAQMQKGMQEISKYTCIQFKPKSSSVFRTVGHSRYVDIFKGSRGLCLSAVGKTGSTGSQNIEMADGCGSSIRVVVHELLHTLGLKHSHQRPDRDSYVKINDANLVSKAAFTENLKSDTSMPYDVSSVMHYDGKFMAKPNTKSLELPNSLRLLKSSHKVYDQYGGNARTASALSHRDHFSINMLYNCAECCAPKACLNGGYQGSSCDCVCPYGLQGKLCQTVSTAYTKIDSKAGCASLLTSASGTIKSSKFPNGWVLGDYCNWMIKTSPNKRIRIKITTLNIQSCGQAQLFIRFFGPDVDLYRINCDVKSTYLNQWFYSQTESMYIIFYAGIGSSTGGFSITYETGCKNSAGKWVTTGCSLKSAWPTYVPRCPSRETTTKKPTTKKPTTRKPTTTTRKPTTVSPNRLTCHKCDSSTSNCDQASDSKTPIVYCDKRYSQCGTKIKRKRGLAWVQRGCFRKWQCSEICSLMSRNCIYNVNLCCSTNKCNRDSLKSLILEVDQKIRNCPGFTGGSSQTQASKLIILFVSLAFIACRT